jgi:hypothetical protein
MYNKRREEEKSITVAATTIGSTKNKNGLIFDTAASAHMVRNERYLWDIKLLATALRVETAENKQEAVTLATHEGVFKFLTKGGSIIQGHAYLAPLKVNILSADEIVRTTGKRVTAVIEPKGGRSYIQIGEASEAEQYEMDDNIPHNMVGNFVQRTEKQGEDGNKDENERTMAEIYMTNLENAINTHNRTGHRNMRDINTTIDNQCIKGAKRIEGDSTRLICPMCAAAKMTKQPSAKSKHKEMVTEVPGCTYSIDRMEFPTESIDGAKSCLVIVDIATKLVLVVPTATKSSEEFMENIVPMIVNRARHTTRKDIKAEDLTLYMRNCEKEEEREQEEANPYHLLRIRSDGEFATKEMRGVFEEAGFETQSTASYDSASNPFAETMIRRLRESIRTFLFGAAMPDALWTDAIHFAAASHNRMSHSTLVRRSTDKTKTRFESPEMRTSGKIAKYDHMHVPFCPVWCWANPDATGQSSMATRGVQAIYAGNDPNDPGIFLVRVTGGKNIKELMSTNDERFKKVIRVHHVVFDDWFSSCENNSPYYRQFRANREGRGTADIATMENDEGSRFEYVKQLIEIGQESMIESDVFMNMKRVQSQLAQRGARGTQVTALVPRKQREKKKEAKENSAEAKEEKDSSARETGAREIGMFIREEFKSGKGKKMYTGRIIREQGVGENRRFDVLFTDGQVVQGYKDEKIKKLKKTEVTTFMKSAWEKAMKSKKAEKSIALQDVDKRLFRAGAEIEVEAIHVNMMSVTEYGDWERLTAEAKESLGGVQKRTGTSDAAGWVRALQKSEEYLEKKLLASVLDDEKPYRGAQHEMIRLADEKEILNLIRMGVFEEEEEIPSWAKALTTTMVRKIKTGIGLIGGLKAGEVEAKSRLCVQDYASRMGPRLTDPKGVYAEFVIKTFAPTSSARTKRLFFFLASILGITDLNQCDVIAAFCNSVVAEWIHIYVNIHPAVRGFVKPTTKFLRLKRYLYGIRSSPAEWFKTFTEVIHEAGYKSLGVAFDPCLLFRVTTNASGRKEISVILLHTDDLLHFSQQKGEWERRTN